MSEYQIIRFCAPTLAGLKTASLFCCDAPDEAELLGQLRHWNTSLAPKGLRMLPLRIWNGRALIYLYRPKALARDLACEDAACLLNGSGYDGTEPSGCLRCLMGRLQCQKDGFPHEIGLFLGYPPEDVRGWFQSSLLTSVGALGQGAPFRECLTHGWTVDGEGKAMHKSLGNGVDPADLIRDFGADIVRLWAASADYRADVRCSKEIFKQLSQNYLKFRNTARYCLGNLDGFDAEHLVAPEDMLELDRWAVTKLNELIRTAFDAYDNYEFHVLTHAINDFCVVELSSFYLDILKDRLYCESRNGLKRRSAQTALYLIVDAMARMFAPILPFTCDEIWQAMPHRAGDDVRNVVLNEMVQPYEAYALDAEAMARWDTLIALRGDVNGVLEQARADKRIGKALEAHVALCARDEAAAKALETVKDMDLTALLLVSDVILTDDDPDAANVTGSGTAFPGLRIEVRNAEGVKCPRCWMHSTKANADGLCPRCAAVMAELDLGNL